MTSFTLHGRAEGSPPAIGHYSHAVELPNGAVLLSGQKAWDPSTGRLIEGDIRAQTDLVFANIRAVLRGLDLDLDSIVRVSCHLAELDRYEEFNEAYARNLGEHRPARTVLAGYTLRGRALVELVVEAFRPSGRPPVSRDPA